MSSIWCYPRFRNQQEAWTTRVAAVTGAVGVHDLFLVFKGDKGETGSHLFNIDYWKFGKK